MLRINILFSFNSFTCLLKATNKVYACKVSRKDHLVNKETGKFDPVEYEEHPERYTSIFAREIAPYTSVLINGIYWAPNSPKLIRIPDAKNLLQPSHQPWLPSSPGCPSLPHRLGTVSRKKIIFFLIVKIFSFFFLL